MIRQLVSALALFAFTAGLLYGVPRNQVIGSHSEVKFSLDDKGMPVLTKSLEPLFIDDGPGKAAGIHRFIGRKPIACYGLPGGQRRPDVHRLSVKNVPVDGFWSISVYNDKGYFEHKDLDSYSLNSLTAKPAADGLYRVQFGGCKRETVNCLVTPAGWNYSVRLYRPRKEVLDGTWGFPEAEPVQ